MSVTAVPPRPGQSISLTETDLEEALLGTFIIHPATARMYAGVVASEWFGDRTLRFIFDAIAALHRQGHEPSVAPILAAMPADIGVPKGELLAHIASCACPPMTVGGVVASLRERWARRRINEVATAAAARALNAGQDPFGLASEIVADIDGVAAARSGQDAVMLGATVSDLIDTVAEPRASTRGATTGLRLVDERVDGYRAGHLYVVAGRPGMGKSAWACSTLRKTAKAGNPVAFFSMEMTADEIAARCLADEMQDPDFPGFGDILRGNLTYAQRAALQPQKEALADLPLWIDPTPSLTVEELIGRARKVQATFEAQGKKLAVLGVDHLTELTPSERYAGNPVMEVSESIKRLRVAAKQLDCAVLVLCQLSRQVEGRTDKRPTLADLRWTGEIEQAAHVVAFLYRDHYYLTNNPEADPVTITATKHDLEFIVAKNRLGKTGTDRLWCDMAHSAIREWGR